MRNIRPNSDHVFPQVSDGVYSLNLGNMTRFTISINHFSQGIFLGIEGRGAYSMNPSMQYPGYVAEKLGILEGDAANIIDFLNDQYGGRSEGYERIGRYYADCCSKPVDENDETEEMTRA